MSGTVNAPAAPADPAARKPSPTGSKDIGNDKQIASTSSKPIEGSKDTLSKQIEGAINVARTEIVSMMNDQAQPNLAVYFLKLAFYDAGTYDANSRSDGANGSIRLRIKDLENGVNKAITKLEELKSKGKDYQYISYADLYQLAGVEAAKKLAGQDTKLTIEFEAGRTDSCIPTLNELPSITKGDASHIRNVFYRMGFNDQEIVALAWAYNNWGPAPLPAAANSFYLELKKKMSSPTATTSAASPTATTSASSPTATTTSASSPTTTEYNPWICLCTDEHFRKYVNLYAENPTTFSRAYAAAHQKMSELGFKKFPEPTVSSDKEYEDTKKGIAVAIAMTILVGFLGFFYESIMRT